MAVDAGVLEHAQEYYDKKIHEILFKSGPKATPLFAMAEMKGNQEMFGRKFVVRVTTSPGSAVSADPTTADNIATDGALGSTENRDRWEVSEVSMDSTFKFSRDDLRTIGQKKPSAQFDLITQKIDLSIHRLKMRLCQQVSNNGWGAASQLSGAPGSTYIIVPTARLNRFVPGDRLVASATEDTDVLLGSAAALRVTGHDAANPGRVLLSGDPTSVWSGIDSNDWVFYQGDRIATDPNADASLKRCITGVTGWVDPAGGTMFGIARANIPELTGINVDATGLDTKAGLIKMANEAFYRGKKLDMIVVSGTSWELLMLDADAQKHLTTTTLGEYGIGFDAFKLATIFGTCEVVPDPYMLAGHAVGGPFKDADECPYFAYSTNQMVEIEKIDGLEFRRVAGNGSRDYIGNVSFHGNYVVPGPGNYVRCKTLPTS